MLNGSFLILEKENDRKSFFLFEDGDVRDMTNGCGELMDAAKFNEVYHNLEKEGYVEV